jgi:flavin reductase (DIM6/NTAB) family NADH-FMN oxidoreductase RutF
MGVFPTGVTVVAARGPDGDPCGLTVNSFTSVSLDPPLVLVCLDRTASTHDNLIQAPTFTVSILGAHQTEMATRFAFDPSESRFRDEEWRSEDGGALVPEGAAAWLACRFEALYEAGDHSILVGRVTSMGAGTDEALVFYRGRYATVTP